jgi:uncharacterized protein (DUF2267 family)
MGRLANWYKIFERGFKPTFIPMETYAMNFDKSEWKLISKIGKEWSLSDTKTGATYVIRVLQALRQGLTFNQANMLANQLPDFLKLAFVTNWKVDERKARLRYVDQVVNWVLQRDRQGRKRLFKSEIHALSVVVFILKYLDNIAGISELPDMSWEFKSELEKIYLDEVA